MSILFAFVAAVSSPAQTLYCEHYAAGFVAVARRELTVDGVEPAATAVNSAEEKMRASCLSSPDNERFAALNIRDVSTASILQCSATASGMLMAYSVSKPGYNEPAVLVYRRLSHATQACAAKPDAYLIDLYKNGPDYVLRIY